MGVFYSKLNEFWEIQDHNTGIDMSCSSVIDYVFISRQFCVLFNFIHFVGHF